MVHIIGRWDKYNPTDKLMAHKKVMALFEEYRKTGETARVEEIQNIIEQMDMPFVFIYKDPGQDKETPHFFLPKRLQGLSKKEVMKRLNW